jgi:hypothetical protein
VTKESAFDPVDPDGSPAAGEPLTDDELTVLALAADPDAPLSDDAVPLGAHLAQFAIALPDWYMPSAMARRGKRWRLPVVLTVVSAFLIIEAMGLCNTYGLLSLA